MNFPNLLTPGEVADIFAVDPKTVNRWAKQGKIPYIKTLGGHLRFNEEDIKRLFNEGREEAQ